MPQVVPKPKTAKRGIKKAAKTFAPKTTSARLAKRMNGEKKIKLGNGPTRVEFDLQELEDLTASVLKCPLSELATMMGVDGRTLKRAMKKSAELRGAFRRGRQRARFNLRRIQNMTANAGDSRIQIWLGKNYLDQKEPKSLHEITGGLDLALGAVALNDRLADLIAREEKTIRAELLEPRTQDAGKPVLPRLASS